MTVGPVQPGLGWAATPTGLAIDDDVLVVVHDLHALDGFGHDLQRRGGLRQLHLEPGARGDTLGLHHPAPSMRTLPSEASSAALVREKPNMRASAASTRSPSRPSGTGRVRVSGMVLTHEYAAGRRYSAGPSRGGRALSRGGRSRRVQAAEGEQHDQDAAADDRGVGEVEDREVLGCDEVHHGAPEDAGRAEDPVGEVAERAAEQQAERDRPGHAAQLAGEPDDHHDDDGGDQP